MTKRRIFDSVSRSAYLRILSDTGDEVRARATLGFSRQRIKGVMDADPEFAAAVAEAKQEAMDRLEGEAYRRAVIGIEEPVFFEGRRVDSVRKYSDSLLAKLLEANDPRYASRVKLSGDKGGAPIQIQNHNLGNLSDEQLSQLEQLLAVTGAGKG